jgi:hypothetical protein
MKQARILKSTATTIIFLCYLLGVMQPLYANEVQANSQSSFFSKLSPQQANVMFQIGGFNATQGNSQHVNIKGLIGDQLNVTQHNDQNILLGVGYFIDGLTNNHLQLLYGLNLFYLGPTTVKGQVIQEDLFNNLSYQYNVTNYPIYAAIKGLVKSNSDRYNFTVNAGVGPNILSTNNFNETSRDGGFTLPDHAYSGNTSIVPSATVGVGIQFTNVYKNMPVECGYQFFYLGQNNFNRTNDEITNTINTGDIYANALMCAVTI